jgi:predicted small lipoprotein YifL
MMTTHFQQAPGWLATLMAIALATAAAGCGLKGDLYLEKPEADKSPAAASNEGGDEPDTAEAATPESIAAEAPEETAELVNTEAAMDADPGSTIIAPGDINDLEGPGDTAAEQLSSEAAMATGPSSVEIEPVTQSELEGPDAETANDPEDTTAKPDEANAAPADTAAQTGNNVSAPTKETSDIAAPAQ